MNKDKNLVKAKLNCKYVKMLAPFIARNDIRRYLCGIHVERAPDEIGGVYAVAADGHCLAVVHDKDGLLKGADSVILASSQAMEAAASKFSRSKDPYGRPHYLLLEAGRLTIASDFGLHGLDLEKFVQPGQAILAGKYPNWKKVVPDFSNLKKGAVIQDSHSVNIHYLARLSKVTNENFIQFWSAGEDGRVIAQFETIPELVTIVMPARNLLGTINTKHFPNLTNNAPA